jgi:NTE family protein
MKKLKKFLFIITIFFIGNSFLFAQQGEKRIIKLDFENPEPPTHFPTLKQNLKRPKLGLALSGGSALGFAQIGILKVLEKEKIPINFVAGTSMGGVIGGLYACGYNAFDLENLVTQINWNELLSDTPPRSALFLSQKEEKGKYLIQIRMDDYKPYIPKALTSGQKISSLFTELTMSANFKANMNFDKLEIPLRIVTTDLINGERKVIDSGDLAEALRATIAIPLVFTPLEKGESYLVDGGLVDPIPVGLTKEMGADFVIAVNTSSALLPPDKIRNPIDIANQTTTIMSLEKKNQELAQANFIFQPDLSNFSATDFDKAPQIIKAGEREAYAKIDSLKKLLESRSSPVDSPEIFFIDSIKIEGNHSLTSSFIQSFSTLSLGKAYSLDEIRNGLGKIYQSGFFSSVWGELDSNQNSSSTLFFHLSENPQVLKVSFSGNTVFPDSFLRKTINQKTPEILNSQNLETGLNRLIYLYQKQGYSLAKVSSIIFDSLTQELKIGLDEGIISEIKVSGNKRTKNWVILRNFPLKPKKPYNSFLVNQGISNIYSSGLFEIVNYNITSASPLVLEIKVKEKKFTSFRLGAHYADEYYGESFLELLDENLAGIGNEIFAHLQYGKRREVYSLNFKADRIFKSYLTYKLSFYYKREERGIFEEKKKVGFFEEKRKGGIFSFGQHIKRLGIFSLEGRGEQIIIDNKLTSLKDKKNLHTLTLRSLVDTFDKYPFPDRGKFHHFYFEMAQSFLGGNFIYKKSFTSLESYFPLGKKFNFHPKVSMGISRGILPLSEKFSLGGSSNFFGYDFEELRGDKLLLFNLHLRYKLTKRVYLNFRYDVGNIWSKIDAIKISQVRHGAGWGISFDTPLGPIDFSYGMGERKRYKFYLKAGFDF